VPVARTHSIALVGVEGHPVEIESDIENGLPGLLLVGLPDTALREARDRIRAAIINSGEQWPSGGSRSGVSPASLPKRGSGFDLGIAVSVLAAAGTVPVAAIEGVTFLGELGLDGQLRPVCGVLPAVAAAAAAGFRKVAVPEASAQEATLVPEMAVVRVPGPGRARGNRIPRTPGRFPARRGGGHNERRRALRRGRRGDRDHRRLHGRHLMPDARVNVPASVARGKPFEVRIIIRHAMETGYRTDESGKSIPRNVIRTFVCRYGGEPVFTAR
jgi:Predicted ATPase with chaperone activity